MLVPSEAPPRKTFARLNSAIAWRVLRARGEHGAVLQGRFLSSVCEDEAAVFAWVAYVVGNPPSRHGVVRSFAALR